MIIIINIILILTQVYTKMMQSGLEEGVVAVERERARVTKIISDKVMNHHGHHEWSWKIIIMIMIDDQDDEQASVTKIKVIIMMIITMVVVLS